MSTPAEIRTLFERIIKNSIADDRKSAIAHLRFALLHAQTAQNLSRTFNSSLNYDPVYVCVRQLIALLESDVETPAETSTEHE